MLIVKINLNILNKNLNSFVKKYFKDPYLICNPYLFVIKNNLNEKNKFLVDNLNLFKFFFIVFYLIRNLLQNFFYILFSIFKNDNFFFNNFLKNKVNNKFLIISHLINENHLSKKHDFYMKNIEILLKKKKINYDLILINNISKSNIKLNKKNLSNKIIFPIYGSIFEEIFLFYKRFKYLLLSHFFFRKFFKKSFLLYINICFSAFDPQFRFNQLFCIKFKKLVELKKYNFILNTYEGHAIDRMIKCIGSRINKKLINFGYYHGAFFKNLVSCKNKISSFLFPNYIFVSNKDMKIFFLKKKFKVYLLNKPYCKIQLINKKKKNICAVLPEGLVSETKLLIRKVCELATFYKNIKFIFKLHPVLEKKKYNYLFANIRQKNIFITKKDSLLLKNSKWCIYRGSSSILNYVSNGCFPIYFNIRGEVNADPLSKFGSKKRYFSNIIQFKKILNLNQNIPKKNHLKLINFCRKYFNNKYDDSNKIVSLIKNEQSKSLNYNTILR